jgi:hypothetical protein
MKRTLAALMVAPGRPARLDRRDPAWEGGPQFDRFGAGADGAREPASL